MAEIKIYKISLKGLKIIGMSLPFIFIGVWMIYNSALGSTNYIMGWVCTCFFGLGIPVGLFQTFDRRPQIIINENGIWDRTTKQDEIKWEQIMDAYPLDIFDQKFVSIVTDDSFVIKKRIHKWAAKLNKAIGAENLNIQLSQTNVDEHKLTELIKSLAKAEKEDRGNIIQSFKIIKYEFSLSSGFKVLLYISISIALLLLSLTGITAIIIISAIAAIGTLTERWYSGDTEKLLIRKYAKIIAMFGGINFVLCFATFETYDYVSENVGRKLSNQIEFYTRVNASYPTDFNSILESTDLNLLEEIFAKSRVQYEVTDNSYELRSTNLLDKEKTYDRVFKEWN